MINNKIIYRKNIRNYKMYFTIYQDYDILKSQYEISNN